MNIKEFKKSIDSFGKGVDRLEKLKAEFEKIDTAGFKKKSEEIRGMLKDVSAIPELEIKIEKLKNSVRKRNMPKLKYIRMYPSKIGKQIKELKKIVLKKKTIRAKPNIAREELEKLRHIPHIEKRIKGIKGLLSENKGSKLTRRDLKNIGGIPKIEEQLMKLRQDMDKRFRKKLKKESEETRGMLKDISVMPELESNIEELKNSVGKRNKLYKWMLPSKVDKQIQELKKLILRKRQKHGFTKEELEKLRNLPHTEKRIKRIKGLIEYLSENKGSKLTRRDLKNIGGIPKIEEQLMNLRQDMDKRFRKKLKKESEETRGMLKDISTIPGLEDGITELKNFVRKKNRRYKWMLPSKVDKQIQELRKLILNKRSKSNISREESERLDHIPHIEKQIKEIKRAIGYLLENKGSKLTRRGLKNIGGIPKIEEQLMKLRQDMDKRFRKRLKKESEETRGMLKDISVMPELESNIEELKNSVGKRNKLYKWMLPSKVDKQIQELKKLILRKRKKHGFTKEELEKLRNLPHTEKRIKRIKGLIEYLSENKGSKLTRRDLKNIGGIPKIEEQLMKLRRDMDNIFGKKLEEISAEEKSNAKNRAKLQYKLKLKDFELKNKEYLKNKEDEIKAKLKQDLDKELLNKLEEKKAEIKESVKAEYDKKILEEGKRLGKDLQKEFEAKNQKEWVVQKEMDKLITKMETLERKNLEYLAKKEKEMRAEIEKKDTKNLKAAATRNGFKFKNIYYPLKTKKQTQVAEDKNFKKNGFKLFEKKYEFSPKQKNTRLFKEINGFKRSINFLGNAFNKQIIQKADKQPNKNIETKIESNKEKENKSRKFFKCQNLLLEAEKELQNKDKSRAEELYSRARETYIDLEYLEKKEIYDDLAEFYKNLIKI